MWNVEKYKMWEEIWTIRNSLVATINLDFSWFTRSACFMQISHGLINNPCDYRARINTQYVMIAIYIRFMITRLHGYSRLISHDCFAHVDRQVEWQCNYDDATSIIKGKKNYFCTVLHPTPFRFYLAANHVIRELYIGLLFLARERLSCVIACAY